ncbi:MAG: hypothetical protein PHU86_04295 [Patescibacteria group bacterium]|nr:hypothetical protein [Patescibacteria group bacterium]
MQNCPICNNQPIEIVHLPETDCKKIKCILCGSFIISNTALADRTIDKVSKEDRILFSGYIRENDERGNILKLLSDDILKIPEKVASYNRLTVVDKLITLITYFARTSKYIGQEVKIDYLTEFTKFFCKDANELRTLLSYLKERGYVNFLGSLGSTVLSTELTVAGWQEYENIKEPNINSKKVFVAMSFQNSAMKEIFNRAISIACEECGLNAIRMDLIEHNEKICDEIISEIKASRLLIADFTGQRQNVYFEAGLALGLGIKVIWLCRDVEKAKLHFDTRQYNHIFWKDAEDLRLQLVNRIKATVL